MTKKANIAAGRQPEIISEVGLSQASNETAADVNSFAAQIKTAWQKSVGGIIEVGHLLIRAKNELAHGQFTLLFREKKLPFSDRTGQRLMEIARHPLISDPAHGSALPPHWRTLHALTRLPAERLGSMLADGTIHAETERGEAERLAKGMDPNRILDALSDLAEFQKDWADPTNLVAELSHDGNIDSNDILSASGGIGEWISAIAAAWHARKSEAAATKTPSHQPTERTEAI